MGAAPTEVKSQQESVMTLIFYNNTATPQWITWILRGVACLRLV